MVKQLEFCEKILNRLYEDNYILPEYDKYLDDMLKTNKYGIPGISYTNEQGLSCFMPDEDSTEYKFDKELTEKNWKYEEFMKSRDKRLLYSMLDKYLDTWWD